MPRLCHLHQSIEYVAITLNVLTRTTVTCDLRVSFAGFGVVVSSLTDTFPEIYYTYNHVGDPNVFSTRLLNSL